MEMMLLRLKYFFRHHTVKAIFVSILVTFALFMISVAITSPETVNNSAESIKDASSELASNISSRTMELFGVTPEPLQVAVVGDCEDEGNQANCNAIPGCSWSGGQTVQCNTYSYNNCPSSCIKTNPVSKSCHDFDGNETACNDTAGCDLEVEEDCDTNWLNCSWNVQNCSQPTCDKVVNTTPAHCSCSAFNASQSLCQANGCTWINQQVTTTCTGQYPVQVNCEDEYICNGTYLSGGSCSGTFQTGGSCTGDPIQNTPPTPSPTPQQCSSVGYTCTNQQTCTANGGTLKPAFVCSSGSVCCYYPTQPSPSPTDPGGGGGPPGACEPECTSSAQCGQGEQCVYTGNGCDNYCAAKPQICDEGEFRCLGNNLQECVDGGTSYTTTQSCQSGTTCNAFLGICQQTTGTGATICEPECQSSSDCGSGEYCNITPDGCSNACIAQSCEPGSTYCKDYKTSVSCNSQGVSVPVSCQYACVNGGCRLGFLGESCNSGSSITQCEPGMNLECINNICQDPRFLETITVTDTYLDNFGSTPVFGGTITTAGQVNSPYVQGSGLYAGECQGPLGSCPEDIAIISTLGGLTAGGGYSLVYLGSPLATSLYTTYSSAYAVAGGSWLYNTALASYSTATAFLSTSAGLATTVGLGGLGLDVLGNAYASYACTQDPGSPECAGLIATWQLGILNQLAYDIDELTSPLQFQLSQQLYSYEQQLYANWLPIGVIGGDEYNYAFQVQSIINMLNNAPGPLPPGTGILQNTTIVANQPLYNNSPLATVDDANFNYIVQQLVNSLGNPADWADGIYPDDISNAIFAYNQSVYNSDFLTDPWYNQQDLIGKLGSLNSAYEQATLGDYFSTQPGCVGNVCYQNAILANATAATYGIETSVSGWVDTVSGAAHAVLTAVDPVTGKITVSDPTWGVSFGSIQEYEAYLSNLGYSIKWDSSEEIFIPKP